MIEEKAWRLILSKRFSWTEVRQMDIFDIERADEMLTAFKKVYDDYY